MADRAIGGGRFKVGEHAIDYAGNRLRLKLEDLENERQEILQSLSEIDDEISIVKNNLETHMSRVNRLVPDSETWEL